MPINVSVVSHAEYVPTLTAAAVLRVKAALSIAACLVTLTFDLESGVRVTCDVRTWATSVPISVFLGLSVLDLGIDVRDTDVSIT